MTRRNFAKALAATTAIRASTAAENDPALKKATQAVLDGIAAAEADPDRPVYHFHPPANWTNDPKTRIFGVSSAPAAS